MTNGRRDRFDIGSAVAHGSAGASPSRGASSASENPDYLTKQLLTYIGNKRALLEPIGEAVAIVKSRLGRDKLRCWDAFSGSGVVSRFLKSHSSHLIANDLEDYSAVVNRCHLTNECDVHAKELSRIVAELNAKAADAASPPGFIEEMYAPKNENRIRGTDRVFYTRENARRIDNYRRQIDLQPVELRDLLLGPLLSEASVHANTAGVFKGFYKDRRTGLGRFGGSGADALSRIRGEIRLEPPVLSRFACRCEVFQEDANDLAKRLPPLDFAYIDPPYNQHPYGSNYFMLNLIVDYRRPENVSRVSGIPADWRRSGYNVKARAAELLQQLLADTPADFLLVSFNNEGFIDLERMLELLNAVGRVQMFERKYNAFRGSRSFAKRSLHTTERMFLVER
ncbi:MAG: DNA adenine methylase [Gemmataceae bacterium]